MSRQRSRCDRFAADEGLVHDGTQICVDGVRSVGDHYWATVCDPADADLHVQSFAPGRPFVYEASPQISFDLWGQRSANAYAGGATGRVRDWPFIYRTS